MEAGYLPEAVINFVAFLGWNPGTTQEVFTREQLISAFSLSRVQKGGAIVNLDKMNWFNSQHLRRMVVNEMPKLIAMMKPKLLAAHPNQPISDEYIAKVFFTLKDHVFLLPQFIEYSTYYFSLPTYHSTIAVQMFTEKIGISSLNLNQSLDYLDITLTRLSGYAEDSEEFRNAAVMAVLVKSIHDQLKISPRRLLTLLRWALSGQDIGPTISEIICTLGKTAVIQRIQLGKQEIEKQIAAPSIRESTAENNSRAAFV